MEGAADREVFGVRDVAPLRHVRVLAVVGDRATLATGAALGAAVGARYAVYPPGTKAADGAAPLGELEITAVGAAESEARVVAGVAVADGRAVERAVPADARLPVDLAGSAADDVAMRGAVSDSSLLAVAASAEGAAARVYLVAPRAGAAPNDPVPQLGAVAAPTWAVVGTDGQLLASPRPLAERAAVVDALETVARHRRVLALANRDPDTRLAGRVTLELLRRGADGAWAVAEPEAGGLPVYEAGERIGFRVTSHHDAPVYVTVLDLGPTGYIGVVFPPRGAQDVLEPGVTLDVVGRRPEARGYEMQWPAGFPFGPADGGAGASGAAADEGRETIKLVGTTAPADFSFVSQRGTRGAAPVDPTPRRSRSRAERLLRAAAGESTRDVGSGDGPGDGDDWTVVDRPFVLRRASRATLAPDGVSAAVGGATIRATGVGGAVRAAPAPAPSLTGDPLGAALGSAGATVRRTITVVAAAPATRDAGAPTPTLDLVVDDPGAGMGELVVSTDAAGVVSFHFAEAEAGATRGTLAPGARTFRVAVRTTPNDTPGEVSREVLGGGTRGLDLAELAKGGVTKLVLKHVVFPLVDPIVGAVGEHFARAGRPSTGPTACARSAPDDYAEDGRGRWTPTAGAGSARGGRC